MLQFETNQAPDDLFNLFPKNEINKYLWEMLQGWIIFLTQREKDDLDIATRMYFYELLNHLLSHLDRNRELSKEALSTREIDALGLALIELLHPLAIYWKESAQIQHWYILLPHLSPDEHDELETVIGFLGSCQSGNQIHCISASYLKKNLEIGNPYLWSEVLPSEAYYLAPGFEPLPLLKDKEQQQVFSKAVERLEIGLKKAEEFWVLAQQTEGNMKPFLLHQTTEMALRSILFAWEKLDKKTHEIRVLLRFASKYNSKFQEVFSGEDELILNLIDKCYTNTRYKEDFKVEQKYRLKLEHKVKQILSYSTDELERLKGLALAKGNYN